VKIMTTHRYKSDLVLRDIVLKSAMFAFVAGLAVNLPIAIVIIATSATSDALTREDYRQAILLLPIIHMMVFTLVFILMCSMFIIIESRVNGDNPK